jgi:hypothetical protein
MNEIKFSFLTAAPRRCCQNNYFFVYLANVVLKISRKKKQMKGHDIYNKSAWVRYTLIGAVVVWVVLYLVAGKGSKRPLAAGVLIFY